MIILVLWGLMTLLGVFLTLRANQFSVRYNDWTTSFRERNPHINPPPTPEMRALNTRIMARLFRIVGVFIALLSAFMAYGSFLLVRGTHGGWGGWRTAAVINARGILKICAYM